MSDPARTDAAAAVTDDAADRAAPWGKLDAAAGTRHHLAHHCADVAMCFLSLARGVVVKARLDHAAARTLSEGDLERLAVLVFLHDTGKLHPGFQAKGWPDGIWRGPLSGHVKEGLEVFLVSHAGQALAAATHLRVDALAAWGVAEPLLRAVISHHGRPAPSELASFDRFKHYWRPHAGYDPDAAAKEIGALLPRWFPRAFDNDPALIPDTPAFDHLMCGLTSLADWIGSDVRWFAHRPVLAAEYYGHATRAAADACRAIGIDVTLQRVALPTAPGFDRVSHHAQPNPQQALVGATSLDARLVILEAETGSGKTEAALWRYAQLFAAGHVDGLYFAVPTRAAAAQLHKRVCDAAKRLFGNASPQPVLAVPGYVRSGDAEGSALPHWAVLWDDAATASQAEIDGRWAAEHSKRFLAAPIAVGTVDQAMLGALKVKHAHLRASSLARSLLVIDEVHASDRYMTTVQQRLLDGHLAVGGHAMLMSATLGAVARDKWLKRRPTAYSDAITLPYPAVWTSQRSEPRVSREMPAKRTKSVRMESLATMAPEALAQRALEAARAGARVLVIRNTVKRAVETLQSLEALMTSQDEALRFAVGQTPTLHHSRFAPSDRKLLDAAVEAELATRKERPAGGRIVIGTQTLEQSLDIDADFLLTDLCPADVLLQRIGRLHRHTLPRPGGFEQARCIVMVPDNGLEPLLAPGFENGLGAWRAAGVLQGVYCDLSILELTRRLIDQHATWSIPDMNRLLVENATHPERIEALHEELGPSWRRYHDEIVGRELADAVGAQGVLIDRRRPFDELGYPTDGEERIRTRLGQEGLRVAFPEPPAGPFGAPVTEIVIPPHWSHGLAVDEPAVVRAATAGTVLFSVSGFHFQYDRFGLSRA